ncbi:hypothetical protein IKS57_01140 [bacterium]|nr:hypothetical protein [bacterium]
MLVNVMPSYFNTTPEISESVDEIDEGKLIVISLIISFIVTYKLLNQFISF